MKLEDVLSKKGVKKVRKEVVETGQESCKRREKKWEVFKKQDKLAEIRYNKYMKKLKELEKERERKTSMEYVYRQWQKIDYVLKWVLTPEAYKYLEKKRENEPKLYKQLFQCIVDPKTIENIDDYVDVIQRRGRPKTLIRLKTLLNYEKKLTGKKRDPNIYIKRKGEARRKI